MPAAAEPKNSSSKGDGYSGLDEIEDAFDRVSSVADALLDSIRDDSLRGKQNRQSRRKMVNMTPQLQATQDDDDVDVGSDYDEDTTVNSTPNFDDDSIITYGDGDDVSLDGSLAQDMKRLRSSTKAMQKELSKEEKDFHEHVSTGSGRSYFAKKEAEAETPVMANLSMKPSFDTNKYSKPKRPATKSQQQPSVWRQFEQFCTETFGQKPNLLLLLFNIIVWAIFCKFLYNARVLFLDDEGKLSPRGFSLFMY